MHRVGEHPVPAGPLAVRWLGYELLELPRAGAPSPVELELENAGSAPWRSDAERRIEIGYHWLDDRGNAIVWGGLWAPLPREVAPGERVRQRVELRAPLGVGPYTLAFDLVDEGRLWLSEIGNRRLELDVDVQPRISRRALAVIFTPGATELVAQSHKLLEAQDEPLVPLGEEVALAHLAPGAAPASLDWSRRVLDAHEEGYAVVAGSIEPHGRRAAKTLEPWKPGTGRVPQFAHALLCPSLIHGAEPHWAWVEPVEGLPALQQPPREPWLYDGRIALKAPPRSGRRLG
jgi:hypothetical protein